MSDAVVSMCRMMQHTHIYLNEVRRQKQYPVSIRRANAEEADIKILLLFSSRSSTSRRQGVAGMWLSNRFRSVT